MQSDSINIFVLQRIQNTQLEIRIMLKELYLEKRTAAIEKLKILLSTEIKLVNCKTYGHN